MRIGIGYDLHRLEPGRRLVLGGTTIPFEKGLLGHSDGDALAHAIIDALLGAASLGNIGQHFPDTSPKFKNADSMTLLLQAVQLLTQRGYRIINIDANIVAEQPKLLPFLPTMSARLAECLGVSPNDVSVKAKTNEGVGPEGRGEAMSVHAVALIEKNG